MRKRLLALFLLAPTLIASGSGPTPPHGHGHKNGGYTFTISGDYSGTGSASVTQTSITLALNITLPDGSCVSLAFNDLVMKRNRFTGKAAFGNSTLDLFGRVDLPAATDDQETLDQAITARVTATIVDATGKGARLVAIQDVDSRVNDTSTDHGHDHDHDHQ